MPQKNLYEALCLETLLAHTASQLTLQSAPDNEADTSSLGRGRASAFFHQAWPTGSP